MIKRHWVRKYESRMCASGKLMKIREKRLANNCHRCNEPCKIATYILKCESVGSILLWISLMDDLNEWLVEKNT